MSFNAAEYAASLEADQFNVEDWAGELYVNLSLKELPLSVIVNDKIVPLKIVVGANRGKLFDSDVLIDDVTVAHYRYIVQFKSRDARLHNSALYLVAVGLDPEFSVDDFPGAGKIVHDLQPKILCELVKAAKGVGLLDDNSDIIVQLPPTSARRVYEVDPAVYRLGREYAQIFGFEPDDDYEFLWTKAGPFIGRVNLIEYKTSEANLVMETVEQRLSQYIPLHDKQSSELRDQWRRRLLERMRDDVDGEAVARTVSEYYSFIDRCVQKWALRRRAEAIGALEPWPVSRSEGPWHYVSRNVVGGWWFTEEELQKVRKTVEDAEERYQRGQSQRLSADEFVPTQHDDDGEPVVQQRPVIDLTADTTSESSSSTSRSMVNWGGVVSNDDNEVAPRWGPLQLSNDDDDDVAVDLGPPSPVQRQYPTSLPSLGRRHKRPDRSPSPEYIFNRPQNLPEKRSRKPVVRAEMVRTDQVRWW